MSFGLSIGDFVSLTQLAWKTVQNARLAAGAHHELTLELTSLHLVLQRLEREKSKPESLLNRTEDDRRHELATLLRGCRRLLRRFANILEKYNELPNEGKSASGLWKKIRFGNGEMQDLGQMRLELVTHTNAISMFLNLLLLGSQGKVENYFKDQGSDLQELRQSVDWIVASLQAESSEGSVLSSHADDDKATWKLFRHKLVRQGFRSSLLKKHERRIMEYALELGRSGALDGLERLDEIEETSEVAEDIEEHFSDESEEERETEDDSEVAEDGEQHSSNAMYELEDSEQSVAADQEGPNEGDTDSDAIDVDGKHSQIVSSQPLDNGSDHISSEQTSRNPATPLSPEFGDKAVWKEFRRELVTEGFSETLLKKREKLIMGYVKELGSESVPEEDLDRLGGIKQPSTRQVLGPKSKLLRPVRCPQSLATAPQSKPARQNFRPEDAAKFNIDPSLFLNNWDSKEPPIKLFGSIFDLESLCNWIHDAAVLYDRMQVSRRVISSKGFWTQRAASLQTLLIKLNSRLRVLRQYLPHVLPTRHRRLVQWFLVRGEFLFEYFQEIVTAAQYAVLGMRVQRLQEKSRDDPPIEGFLDHEDIIMWELDPIESIGIRATIDLIWFVFEEAWEDVSYFKSQGLVPWISQVEKDSLAIVREAHAESLRVPTSEQRAAKALVLYEGLKMEKQALIPYRPENIDLLLTVLQGVFSTRQAELELSFNEAERLYIDADSALAKCKRTFNFVNAEPKDFEQLGRLVANEEMAFEHLDRERRLLRTSMRVFYTSFIPLRDYLWRNNAPGFNFLWDEFQEI